MKYSSLFICYAFTLVKLQRKTDLQQKLLSTHSESRKHELESELEKTERNITETVAKIQECEEKIQRLRGGTDRKQSDKKQGELRVSMSQYVHTASGRKEQGRDCYVTKSMLNLYACKCLYKN